MKKGPLWYDLSLPLSVSTVQEYLTGGVDVALPEGSLRRRLARGAFWALASGAIANILGLVVSLSLARMLGKEHFGELALVLSTVNTLALITGGSPALTASLHVAGLRSVAPKKAGRVLTLALLAGAVLGVAACLLLLVLAPVLAHHLMNAPQLAGALRIGSTLLLVNSALDVLLAGLVGLEAFSAITKVNLVRGLANIPCILVGAYIGSIPGALLGQFVATAMSCALVYVMLENRLIQAGISLSSNGLAGELPVLGAFSVPVLLSTVLLSTVGWTANVILVNGPDGFSQIAVFHVANQWGIALTVVPGLLGQNVTAVMVNLVGAGDRSGAHRLLGFTALAYSLLTLVPLSVLAFLSPQIMGQYGAGFREGWPVLVACLGNAYFQVLLTPANSIIAAWGKMWAAFLMNVGWSIILVVSVVLLLDWGALGLASAHLVATALHCLGRFVYVRLHIVFTPHALGHSK